MAAVAAVAATSAGTHVPCFLAGAVRLWDRSLGGSAAHAQLFARPSTAAKVLRWNPRHVSCAAVAAPTLLQRTPLCSNPAMPLPSHYWIVARTGKRAGGWHDGWDAGKV